MSRIAPYIVIALLLAVFTTWHLYRDASDEAERAKAEAHVIQTARDTERAQQEKVNNALRKQNDALAGVNAGLLRDLDRLRKRPNRLPDTSRSSCQGASGAELSRDDSSFLVREAARADRLRAALESCYSAYDAVTKGGK